MNKILIFIVSILILANINFAQVQAHPTWVSALPATCTTNVKAQVLVYKYTSSGGALGLYYCSATNTWSSVNETDATLPFTDITTNNVSITKHGFVPKAPNDATKYLDGTGAWSVPPAPTAFSLSATLPVDDTYSGIPIIGLNAGTTIAQWEAVYLGGSSTWLLADANGSGTYPAQGLAVASYVDTNAATVCKFCIVRNDAWNWTIGAPIYLSGTTGAITQTAPAVSGDKIQMVGYAITADIAYFDFDSTYITIQ